MTLVEIAPGIDLQTQVLEGVTLVEIAPGIDLQTQVLDQMEFMPKIADDLKLMDERIFREELMGLAND